MLRHNSWIKGRVAFYLRSSPAIFSGEFLEGWSCHNGKPEDRGRLRLKCFLFSASPNREHKVGCIHSAPALPPSFDLPFLAIKSTLPRAARSLWENKVAKVTILTPSKCRAGQNAFNLPLSHGRVILYWLPHDFLHFPRSCATFSFSPPYYFGFPGPNGRLGD